MTNDPSPAATPDGEDAPARKTPAKKRRWLRGCLFAFALFVILPAILLVGAWIYRNWRMQSDLDAEIAAAVERGEPNTFQELLGRIEITPAMKEATAHWNAAEAALDERLFSMEARVRDLDRTRKGEVLPYPSEPIEHEPPADERLSDEERYARTADAVLAVCRPAIEEAHAARRSGSVAMPDLVGADPDWDVMLAFRELTDRVDGILELELSRATELHERERVREALLTLLGVYWSDSAAPPGLFSPIQDARFAVWSVDRLAPTLQSNLLSDDDLVELQRALEAIEFDGELAKVAPTARARVLAKIDDYAKRRELRLPGAPPPRPGSLAIDDHWKTYEVTRRFQEQATSYPAAIAAVDSLEAELENGTVVDALRFWDSLDLYVILRGTTVAVANQQAVRNVSLAAVACERYRRKHGAWPPKLDHLVPEFLDEPLSDPFDDQPLHYFADGESMTVYSIGRNREDDGGLVHGSVMRNDTALRLPPRPEPPPYDVLGSVTDPYAQEAPDSTESAAESTTGEQDSPLSAEDEEDGSP